MEIVFVVSLTIGLCALITSHILLISMVRSHMKRIRTIEHFLYPEWADERGWDYARTQRRTVA